MPERILSSPSSEDAEWDKLADIMHDVLHEEELEYERRHIPVYEGSTSFFWEEGSDYPYLAIGLQEVPDPGNKDWRLMAPPDSLAYADAIKHPQTPEQYRKAVEVIASLRPSFLQDH